VVGLIAPSISGERKFAGVVGGFCSGVVVTLAPLLNSFSLSFVGGMQGSPELSDRSLFPNFIRLSPSDAAFAEAVAALALHFSWSWVGSLYDDVGYSRFIAGTRRGAAGCVIGGDSVISYRHLTGVRRDWERGRGGCKLTAGSCRWVHVQPKYGRSRVLGGGRGASFTAASRKLTAAVDTTDGAIAGIGGEGVVSVRLVAVEDLVCACLWCCIY
jgi:hypothetical protein